MNSKDSVVQTILNLKKIGFDGSYDYINCNNTCYLNVSQNGVFLFTLRMSDHNLRSGNYLPEGVINEFYLSISEPVSIDMLQCEIDCYLSLDADERDELFENRLIQ
jgi:hypothetical protein